MRTLAAWLSVAAIAFPGAAAALEFRSVSEAAVLYDAPSKQGKKLFVIQTGTPVEVIVGLDQWTKVRDAAGTIAWIERKSLAAARTVIVTAPTAEVHEQADAASPLVFRAEKDVLLEFGEKLSSGWVRVKHRDGTSGFARAQDVWGE
ncbi:hypothetical protein GCM10025771_15020 [Niveibacterium umoris]|uniref:SH3-like domain-containing protein n=1 Tax=Niveibacterium umoris TaxID=1193620 RepID=A0A840BPR9_9RHOO|nr:SH3 domain-containing protein [Niveibacterium umoris]MBB4014623.1 SH3-like domain-containing protein [Niveibacterium umoris]